MSDPAEIPPILLIGLGKMGGAMFAGWRERGLAPSVGVDPARPHMHGLTVVGGAADIPPCFAPQAVVVAVKPQQAAETLPLYSRYVENSVFLSIMAGRTTASIAASIEADAKIVRAMPNTPAAIRQGFTVAFAGPGVSAAQKSLCATLLEAVGEVAWVEDENLLDPVTAVSGGGPAYVFLLAELLEHAAIEQGIPPELARAMARKTVAGSGALLAASDEESAALRKAVTSPKGTTEQALAVLMKADAWPCAVSDAIAAATRRSRELAG